MEEMSRAECLNWMQAQIGALNHIENQLNTFNYRFLIFQVQFAVFSGILFGAFVLIH